MSNSSLVTYTNISGNKTSPRNHVIDTITIHCIVGQWTAKQGCDYFATTDRKCSANYVVGKDGSIGLSVDEADRSWCSSNADNDNRAVTIEVASDTTDPYAVTDAAYNALVQLVADICKRNGIKELKWKADKSLIGQVDKQNMTVHRWFAAKACPGEYLYSRHGDIAAKVNAILGASAEPVASGFQATALKDMGEADIIAKVGALFTADQRKNGVLASVSLAQFILESAYGKSELAQNANNCFGMKCSLSGNTWGGSAWDGASKYAKNTQEYVNGQYVTVTAEFRKYQSVEQSIADHSAYLLGAMNGSKKRYDGLKDCTDYRKAVQIIKDGGYATAPDYVGNICNIIEKWNLTRYDVQDAPAASTSGVRYKVQAGAYSKKENAVKQEKELKAAGFDTYMVKVGNLYKIQVGAYSKKENADAMLAKVKAAGFDAFITTENGEAVATATPAKKEITVGCNVRVNQGAKTYDGKTLKSFVYARNHQVKSISGDRVVITYQGTVVAAVKKSDLTLV